MNLWRLVVISRPIFYIPTLTAYAVGLYAQSFTISFSAVYGALLLTLPMSLIIYGLNDIADRKSDEHNARKGRAQGAIVASSEQDALRLTVLSTIVFCLVTSLLFCGFGYFLATLGLCLFGYVYSVKPFRLKTKPILDSLSNGLWVLLLFLCGYWVGLGFSSLEAPELKMLLTIFFFASALHAIFTLPDIAADKLSGDKTIAVRYGKTFTIGFSMLLLAFCILLIWGGGPITFFKAVAVAYVMLFQILLVLIGSNKINNPQTISKAGLACILLAPLFFVFGVYFQQ